MYMAKMHRHERLSLRDLMFRQELRDIVKEKFVDGVREQTIFGMPLEMGYT